MIICVRVSSAPTRVVVVGRVIKERIVLVD